MYQPSSQPQSIWRIFNDSFKLYPNIWLKCLPITILYAILITLADWAMPQYKNIAGEVVKISAGSPILATILFLVVFFVFISLFYTIMLILQQRKMVLGEIIQVSLLRGLLILVSFAIFYFLFAICATVLFLVLHLVPVVGTLLGLGLIFLASIYVFFSLVAWLPLILAGINPIQAFKQSFKLVNHSWWPTFFLLLSTFVLAFLVQFLLSAILGAVFALIFGTVYIKIVQLVLMLLTSIFILPWSTSIILLQVENLKLKAQSLKNSLLA